MKTIILFLRSLKAHLVCAVPVLLIFLCATQVFSATYYARKSGNWSDNSGTGTWSTAAPGGAACSCKPTGGNDVFIDGAYTVTLDQNVASGVINSFTIQNGGDLIVTGGFDIEWSVDFTLTGAGSTVTINDAGSVFKSTGANKVFDILSGATLTITAGTITNQKSDLLVDGSGTTMIIGDASNAPTIGVSTVDLSTSDDFKVFNNAVVTFNAGTINAEGDFRVETGGQFNMPTGGVSAPDLNVPNATGTLTIKDDGTASSKLDMDAGTIDVTNDLILDGNTVAAPTLDVSGGTVTIGDAITFTGDNAATVSSPSLIVSGGTVNIGGNMTTTGSSTDNAIITVSGTGTVDITGTASIASDATITVSGTMLRFRNTFATSATANENTSISVSGSGEIEFQNTVTTNAGAATTITQSGGTIEFRNNFTMANAADVYNHSAGTAQFTTSAFNWSNIGSYNGSGTATASFEWTGTTGTTLTGNAASWTFENVNIAANAIMRQGSAGGSTPTTIHVKGDWTQATGSTFTNQNNTVDWNGNGTQYITGTLATKTFNTLTLNKTAGQVLEGAGGTTTITCGTFSQTTGDFTTGTATTMNVTGTLTISAGTFTATGGTTINLGGDWTQVTGSVFTPNTSTVTFNGGAGQNINGTLTPKTFYNVTLSNANGLTMGSSANISGLLTMSSGTVDLGANTIAFGTTGALSGESNTNYVFSNSTGTLTATQTLNNPFQLNIAGLGAVVTSAQNLGATSVIRGHNVQSGGGHTGIKRWYDISPANNTALNATIDFDYFDNELNARNENNFKLYKSTDGGTTWNTLSTTTFPAGNYVESVGQGSLARFSVSDVANTLPVQLINFEAANEGMSVKLEWTTATETNSDYFIIERSADAINYTTVAEEKALGNSDHVVNYSAFDNIPLNGVCYYRLKETDYNGKYFYSTPIAVERSPRAMALSIFPNPSLDGSLNIRIDEKETSGVLVAVYDVLGNLYSSKMVLVEQGNVLSVLESDKQLGSGVYFVTASSKNGFYGQKVLVK